MDDQSSFAYFREREQVEREAATQAVSEEARNAHLALAEGYAAKTRVKRSLHPSWLPTQ